MTVDFFFYVEGAVRPAEARSMERFLDAVPVRADADPTQEFVFVPQDVEGHPATRRWEAAAGDPVWTGTGWGPAVAMPGPILQLRERILEVASTIPFGKYLETDVQPRLTSVYVDRYEPGGQFAPHTDGEDAYGPVIGGISLGGTARFCLWASEGAEGSPDAEFELAPNAAYFFCGPIRHRPWVHAIRGVTRRRYGITFRDPPVPRPAT